ARPGLADRRRGWASRRRPIVPAPSPRRSGRRPPPARWAMPTRASSFLRLLRPTRRKEFVLEQLDWTGSERPPRGSGLPPERATSRRRPRGYWGATVQRVKAAMRTRISGREALCAELGLKRIFTRRSDARRLALLGIVTGSVVAASAAAQETGGPTPP